MSKKSLKVAYFLWFFGGFFGLHHFYLERDIQGFLWLCFPGGYFGLGWIRDLWRLPDYVDEANNEPHMHTKKNTLDKPKFSWPRFIGQNLVGNSFGILMLTTLIKAEEYYEIEIMTYLTIILLPLSIAIGKFQTLSC